MTEFTRPDADTPISAYETPDFIYDPVTGLTHLPEDLAAAWESLGPDADPGAVFAESAHIAAVRAEHYASTYERAVAVLKASREGRDPGPALEGREPAKDSEASELPRFYREIARQARRYDTPAAWRKAAARWSAIGRQRPPENARTPRAGSRPRAHRSPRRGSAKTAQDPGDDGGDPDPDDDLVERRVRELVDQAPPLSAGQQRRLAQLLGGTR